ncbi:MULTISPECIES: hypothetical protein [Glaesserella]|uniref:Uncharacterized protein n=1 Tax=Glaesserella australis TaxID=2094024 RepID=A0A328C1I5_9PAST|nr:MULTISPECIES: hypothetical protein [Glaesserella]AUI65916.1 hypothetical protein CJD39_04705 [Glaesserella sp. 15-184]RAL18364.1 hypothetical protein C5N92_09095 [Glaesserella australis]
MSIVFQEFQDDELVYQYADFDVDNTSYTIAFTKMLEGMLDFDEMILRITQGKLTYSIEFTLSEIYYDENYRGELYLPPKNHRFTKSKYEALKTQLFSLIFAHYQRYNPECYLIVADRLSLQKMYQKMCEFRSEQFIRFKPIMGLGQNGECFLILTPTVQEVIC